MNELLDIAMQYRNMGLSVIATDALKQSIGKWKAFQDELPTADELLKMFCHPAANGVALVTGKSSRNLEVIDIDTKNFTQGCLFFKFCSAIAAPNTDLISKLVMVQSRSGGYHMYYRCDQIGPNQALAKRLATDLEKLRKPGDKIKVLIETRGLGGYIVAPPSPGYRFIQHDFSSIPFISPLERNIILQAARTLNQYVEKKVERIPPKTRRPGELSPLDDYNLRGDVIGLLERHGWTVVRQNEKRTWFKRPGKSDKKSSGDYNHEMGLFSVFSTSTEFEPGRGYRPYAVYAVLECGGDFKKAAWQLARAGYGERANQNRSKIRSYSR